jgi:glutaminyl-peptide cyclotransferase
LSARVLVAALAIQLLIGGAFVFAAVNGFPFIGRDPSGHDAATVPAAKTKRFDAARAFALTREQVALGPRPAGSAPSRRLAERMRKRLPGGHFEAVPGRLRNVVGALPGRLPAVVIGAHYDTEATIPHHVGANDGAAGTAVVVELAHALRAVRRRAGAPALRFVLFDGEEEPIGSTDFLRDALRGSKAYARAHGRTTRALILLDYIGNHGLTLPREANSDRVLWDRMRAAARRTGVGSVFTGRTGPSLLDDHIPFVERGIPAVDLIDFSYRYRDTPQDTLDKISPRSLDAVGEAVIELVLGL